MNNSLTSSTPSKDVQKVKLLDGGMGYSLILSGVRRTHLFSALALADEQYHDTVVQNIRNACVTWCHHIHDRVVFCNSSVFTPNVDITFARSVCYCHTVSSNTVTQMHQCIGHLVSSHHENEVSAIG